MKITKNNNKIESAKYGTPGTPRRAAARTPQPAVVLTEGTIQEQAQRVFDELIQQYPEYSFLQNTSVVLVEVRNLGKQYKKDLDIRIGLDLTYNTEAHDLYWGWAPITSAMRCYVTAPHSCMYTGDVSEYIMNSWSSSFQNDLMMNFATEEYISEIQSTVQTFTEDVEQKLMTAFPQYIRSVEFSSSTYEYPYRAVPKAGGASLDYQSNFYVYITLTQRIPDELVGKQFSDFKAPTELQIAIFSIDANDGLDSFIESVQAAESHIYHSVKMDLQEAFSVSYTDTTEITQAAERWVNSKLLPAFHAEFPDYDLDIIKEDGKLYVEVLRDATHTYGGKPIRVEFADVNDRYTQLHGFNGWLDGVMRQIRRAFKYREKYYGDEESSENESDDLVTL